MHSVRPISIVSHGISLISLTHLVYTVLVPSYDVCSHDLEAIPIAELTEDQLAQVGLFAPIMDDTLRDVSFVCVLESVSSDYLNTEAVQQALHVTQANVTNWSTAAPHTELVISHGWLATCHSQRTLLCAFCS